MPSLCQCNSCRANRGEQSIYSFQGGGAYLCENQPYNTATSGGGTTTGPVLSSLNEIEMLRQQFIYPPLFVIPDKCIKKLSKKRENDCEEIEMELEFKIDIK